MADPRTYLVDGSGSGVGGAVTGADANTLFGARTDRALDNSLLWATVTSGGSEGDTVTVEFRDNAASPAVDTQFLERGWLTGMGLRMAWPADNTGAVTVNGINVLTVEGDALTAGQLPAGLVVEMVYASGNFVVTSPLPAADSGPAARYLYVYTSNQTWTKPAGLSDSTIWWVSPWGAGGGGSGNSGSTGKGGGGGSRTLVQIAHGDLPSSVAVTIGTGGAAGAGSGDGGNGGNTTFGSYATGYGGGGGRNGGFGGGAGLLGAGAPNAGGQMGGGNAAGADATLPGAGGAGGDTSGGDSFDGGGGGCRAGTPGSSVMGGNGGGPSTPGGARGGGGGVEAPGGNGELWIWT